jgi:hypothetical protein
MGAVTAISIHGGKQTAMHSAGELDVPQMLSEAAPFSLNLALSVWPSPSLPCQPFLCRYDYSSLSPCKVSAQNLLPSPTPHHHYYHQRQLQNHPFLPQCLPQLTWLCLLAALNASQLSRGLRRSPDWPQSRISRRNSNGTRFFTCLPACCRFQVGA